MPVAAPGRDGGSAIVVTSLALTEFRSYARQELEFRPGLAVVVGVNGAGKTNLLEGIHVGTQGISLRTRRDDRLIHFGASRTRVAVGGRRGESRSFTAEVTISLGEAKRIVLDGNRLASHEELREALPVLVFTPDRLAIVKGSPLVRRTYLDRLVARLYPALASLSAEYFGTLAHRNVALRRVRAGASTPAALLPWTERLAELGDRLDHARARAVEALHPLFTERSAVLGLSGATLGYDAPGLSVDELNGRVATDLERGTTGAGPHLRDLAIVAAGRELRFFGSQGEQRLAVLALLLAEAALLAEIRNEPPLLLLDDVLSELDEPRRAVLLEHLPERGQAFVTTTTLRSLPHSGPGPAVVVEVFPGRAEVR